MLFVLFCFNLFGFSQTLSNIYLLKKSNLHAQKSMGYLLNVFQGCYIKDKTHGKEATS